jgi:HEAT repeat protein
MATAFLSDKQLQKMRKTLLVINLIVFAWLSGSNAAGQRAGDSKGISPSPSFARAQHLLSLIDSKQDDAPAKLKQALADESWYVRGQAARALGRLGDRSAASVLVSLLQDESWFVRVSALEAIATLGATYDVAELRDAMASPDGYVRARATATSPVAGNGAVESLIKALGDGDQLVRRAAAKALGELKATSAVDPLIELLKDEDPGVRRASAVALGRIGDKKAAIAVQTAAGETGAAQWEYAAALYRLGNRDQLDKMTAALHDEYPDAREGALQSLLEFADNRALPALLALGAESASSTKKDGVLIRLALASGLGAFEGEEARVALINMLGDPESAVRGASVGSLLKLGRPDPRSELSQRSLIALVGALKKENSPVVVAAITEALPAFDRSRVADLLLDARTADGKLSPTILTVLAKTGVTAESEASQLSTGGVADRVRAADRLARLGDSKAVGPLIEALNGAKEIEIRVKAAQALGTLRDRNAVEPLITAARAPEAEVRAAAVTALGSIGDHTAAEALFVAARDTDPAVRDAGVRSLSAFGISVEKVTPDLSSSNWQVRAAAVTTLARLGDRNAAPSISLALKDSDSRVRSEAARALSVFNDRVATDALIGALRDQSVDVRVEATFSLGRLKDSRALAPLTSLLSDRDPRVSLAAAESLARLQDPRATRVLIDSLSSPDWRVRSRATQVLARVAGEGALDQATGPLATALADKDPVVRYYASEALVGIGARAIPSLIEAFHSHRESDRDRAARVLWRIGAPAVEPLLAVLQERSATPEMRTASASALGMIGDPRAIKGLALLLRDERYFVRQRAAQALGRIGEPAVDLLLEMSSSSTPATREAAVEALGSTASKRAVDRVIESLSDSNSNVRSAAVRALGESSSESAVPHLMALLRDESSALRGQAAASLAKLGAVALPSLISALKDSKPSVRQLAAEALGDIGSRDAVAPLIELVTTDQSGARPEAIEALGKIGDPAAISPILSVLRTGSVAVRKRAMGALAGFRDSRAIEALTIALSDQNDEVRQAAAAGLGEVADERSIARLERLADNDASSDVRAAAVQAIERIRHDQRPGIKTESQKPSRP